MGISTSSDGTGITTVTIDYAPVNAIPSKGWFELADAILDALGKALASHKRAKKAKAVSKKR